MSNWTMERDDAFPSNRDVWRIIDSDDDKRWAKHNTSARVPYIATVYDEGVAREMCESHNHQALPAGVDRTAMLDVLETWRLSDVSPANAHDGHSRLRERLDWLWDDVKADRPPDYLRARARELAAMALRFVAECTS